MQAWWALHFFSFFLVPFICWVWCTFSQCLCLCLVCVVFCSSCVSMCRVPLLKLLLNQLRPVHWSVINIAHVIIFVAAGFSCWHNLPFSEYTVVPKNFSRLFFEWHSQKRIDFKTFYHVALCWHRVKSGPLSIHLSAQHKPVLCQNG